MGWLLGGCYFKSLVMPKFAANLSMLYPEIDFLNRFEAAARDGFRAVECLFPYAFNAQELAARLADHGLQQVLFNLPPGGSDAPGFEAAWSGGQRGVACFAGQGEVLGVHADWAIRYALALNCPRLHVMAGLHPGGDAHENYVNHVRAVARRLQPHGLQLLIEPINNRDMPGYWLNHQAQAHALLLDVNEPNLAVQMDLYHAHIMDGDLATQLNHYLPTGAVGHMQVAGLPGRHEPGLGEVKFEPLFDQIDALGYTGWVGCEYRPAAAGPGGTSAGLGWLRRWL